MRSPEPDLAGPDSRAPSPDPVDISVVVPVLMDPRLRQCLDALAAQSIGDGRFEVLVVDNGPDALTRRIAEGAHVRYLVEPGGGSYAARACGVAAASGKILVFTDADCVPPPDWLATIDRLFRDDACEVAVGPSSAATDSRVSRWVQSIDAARWAALPRTGGVAFCDTRNLAIRREILLAVPFDPAFRHAGDLGLGVRLRRAGHDVRLEDAMRLTHYHPESVWAVVRRAVRRGRGLALLERKYGAARETLGQRPLRVAGRDVKAGLLAWAARPRWRWLLAGVVTASLLPLAALVSLVAQLPGGDEPGRRLFTLMEREALLLGRALG